MLQGILRHERSVFIADVDKRDSHGVLIVFPAGISEGDLRRALHRGLVRGTKPIFSIP